MRSSATTRRCTRSTEPRTPRPSTRTSIAGQLATREEQPRGTATTVAAASEMLGAIVILLWTSTTIVTSMDARRARSTLRRSLPLLPRCVGPGCLWMPDSGARYARARLCRGDCRGSGVLGPKPHRRRVPQRLRRAINVDSAAYTACGPRRGIGALWGEISVDALTLPNLDRELFARDPLEAATQALEASFSLRADHLEEFVRSELSVGPTTRLQVDGQERASPTADVESDGLWANLVRALRDADVLATPAALRNLPFRMEFDAALIAELGR